MEQTCFLMFFLLMWGFFSHLPSVERTLTLPHTEGQTPRGPTRRIAAHLTGSSSRRSALASRSKEKPLTTVKDHRNYPLVASLMLTNTF